MFYCMLYFTCDRCLKRTLNRLTDPTPAMNRSDSNRKRCVRAAIGTKTVLSDDVSIMNPNTRLPPYR